MEYTWDKVRFVCDEQIPVEEAKAYIKRGREQYPTLTNIDAHVDGEDIELTYQYAHVPFDRIRRITGYLVGTLDRFNDGKRAEEHDRVKHMHVN